MHARGHHGDEGAVQDENKSIEDARRPRQSRTPSWLVALGVSAATLLLYALMRALSGERPPKPQLTQDRPPPAAPTARLTLSAEEVQGIAGLLAATWAGDARQALAAQAGLTAINQGIYVVARTESRRVADAWSDRGTVGQGLVDATKRARAKLSIAGQDRVDALEVCITHRYRAALPEPPRSTALSNAHRGVLGLELRKGSRRVRVSPTWMLATNRSFKSTIRHLRKRHAKTLDGPGPASMRVFDCHQLLIALSDPPRAWPMFRGNQVVEMSDVDRAQVGQLKVRLAQWLLSNLSEDGRMTYKYWPSRGRESQSNNMIRQWMATIALVRIARERGADEHLVARAESNIAYNLKHFFRSENDLGLIEYNGKVKLGAVALAALAIFEHPARARFAEPLRQLIAMTYHLHRPDGSFANFYKPPGRAGLHNFYPGETLLLWSALYEARPDPKLLGRFMRAFRYYRQWHRRHRNPAFVPWHTQAYYRLWRLTQETELRDFVFEINDWLCAFQEWERSVYPDQRGRFYDSRRRHFGPPHASATGVYLEGLIDAYAMAKAVGDADRVTRYRRAILRGLRSVMQLQFVDDVDMYYINRRTRVRGGLRTTVYNNEIRVDNVQHALLGIFRIHRIFGKADYRH